MTKSTLFLCLLPLRTLAQSEPTTMPLAEVEDLLTRTCLTREGSMADHIRLDACNKYLSSFPDGVWREDVIARQRELSPSSTSAPTTEEDNYLDLSEFGHPRKAGDTTLLASIGLNSPSGSFGAQGGYYIKPRLQVLAGFGVDDKHLRSGAMGRFLWNDSRISPELVLGLSFATARQSTGEGTNPTTGDAQVVSVKLSPSLLAHAGIGMSMRYISGFSLNAEAGYAQSLVKQTFTLLDDTQPPPDNEAQLLDGGFFFSVAIGYTFSRGL